MADLQSILAKAKEVATTLEAEGEKDVATALAKVNEIVKELEADVEKGETELNKATDQPTPGATPEGSTTGPQPTDPATDNVNTGDAAVGEAAATPPADVQTSSDLK